MVQEEQPNGYNTQQEAAAVQEPYQELTTIKHDIDSTGNDDPQMELCDFCSAARALVYCLADKARLCLPCDHQVHAANVVSSRHRRSPLCSTCQAAPAAFRRCNQLLCSNCDFDKHGGRHVVADTLHDGRAVEGYTGCPLASEIATVLGIGEYEKAVDVWGGNNGWWSRWEEPQVLTLEDLIIPTTSCHNFQPLRMPASPKNENLYSGKHEEEVLGQLHELSKSETIPNVSNEDVISVTDLHPWAPEYTLQDCNLSFQTNYDTPNIAVSGSEDGQWNSSIFNDPSDNYSAELPYEQFLVSSTEASLSSFVDISEICPSISNTGNTENNLANLAPGAPTRVLPMRGGYEIGCPDRSSIISHYKEKRKTRRYDKLIRYESRKARADGRMRIKGRFAKAN